jgi:hypothetical protein
VVSIGDEEFVGSIPDVYDEYLVPLIFEQYAADLAVAVEARLDPDRSAAESRVSSLPQADPDTCGDSLR